MDLFYPAETNYEAPSQNETQVHKRERDHRNVKTKVEWENKCKAIEFKGPLVDGIPWDEADTKVKSMIYLCIGTEGQCIYHQPFPHSNINTIFAFELLHELSLASTRTRNTIYDRFLLFTCKQKKQLEARDLPLQAQSPRSTMQTGHRPGRPDQGIIHSLYE